MVYSRVDQVYRSLLLSKFFTKGWGKPDNLKRIFEFRKILSNRESCQTLVDKDYPINIDKDYKDGDCRIMEGHFTSPFVHHLPGIMPKEVEKASFQAVLPLEWQHPTLKPICIHLAGTGDHYFWRRRLFTARPLLKDAGIASILLENPYYGSRKPKAQLRSSLHNVSDLFVMGGALVLESLALLHWCERQGWGPFGLSGVSMGGHMASLAATNWEKPISLVPLLSWSTASCVFTQGVMSGAIPWQVLQEQFFKNNLYHDEISKLIVSPEKAYQMGQQFVINYTRDLEDSNKDQNENNSHTSSGKSTSSLFTHKIKQNLQQGLSQDKNDKEAIFSSDFSEGQTEPEVALVGMKIAPSSAASQFFKQNSLLQFKSSNDSGDSDNVNDSDSSTNTKKVQPHLKSPRDDVRRLSLSYAQTKQSQQSSSSISEKNKKLTAGHALAKSKILFSRNRTKKEEEEYKKMKSLREESYEFMRGVMDECTHLGNFSVPVDPELVIIVAATQDAYIPRDGVLPLDKLWPGSEVRYIDQGHVGAVLLHQGVFRKAVVDAFDKQVKKYYPDGYHELEKNKKQPTK